jgi:hypothetical protein
MWCEEGGDHQAESPEKRGRSDTCLYPRDRIRMSCLGGRRRVGRCCPVSIVMQGYRRACCRAGVAASTAQSTPGPGGYPAMHAAERALAAMRGWLGRRRCCHGWGIKVCLMLMKWATRWGGAVIILPTNSKNKIHSTVRGGRKVCLPVYRPLAPLIDCITAVRHRIKQRSQLLLCRPAPNPSHSRDQLFPYPACVVRVKLLQMARPNIFPPRHCSIRPAHRSQFADT